MTSSLANRHGAGLLDQFRLLIVQIKQAKRRQILVQQVHVGAVVYRAHMFTQLELRGGQDLPHSTMCVQSQILFLTGNFKYVGDVSNKKEQEHI